MHSVILAHESSLDRPENCSNNLPSSPVPHPSLRANAHISPNNTPTLNPLMASNLTHCSTSPDTNGSLSRLSPPSSPRATVSITNYSTLAKTATTNANPPARPAKIGRLKGCGMLVKHNAGSLITMASVGRKAAMKCAECPEDNVGTDLILFSR